jgi:signal transduction histidine kinase/DNA-binding response OmpR family regulator
VEGSLSGLPRRQLPEAAVRSRLGVRGRLLLAFFGISAFAILGAGAALYSFREIDGSLGLITQRRIPVVVQSQELSRHAERITAAAPALLTVASQTEKDQWAHGISIEVDTLNELLAQLRQGGVESAALHSLESGVEKLRGNLQALDRLVDQRLMLGEQKKELLGTALQLAAEVQNLLAPWVSVMDERIAQWRRIAQDASVSSERRGAADQEFEKSLAWFRALQSSEVLASSVSDLLQRAAAADNPNTANISGFRAQQALNELERLSDVLDPKLRPLMADTLTQLRPYAVGSGSVPELRRLELSLTENATQLLGENTDLSKHLTATVDSLVAGARKEIDDANAAALSVVDFSTLAVIVAVVLSLVSSTLIVWLYVGRNLIARLRELSDRTFALAAGDLRSPLPPGGDDEIGRMAESLAVFRDTAVAMEEANLKEIREARLRLTEAIEAISEGFSLYDSEDKLIICNTRYKDFFSGHRDKMVPGTPFEQIVRASLERDEIEDGKDDPDAWLATRMERHRNPSEPHIQRRSDGRWVRVSERLTANGGVVATYTDITMLKQREAELADLVHKLEIARDAANEASRTKSTFLANMSHELRTPLNAIIGYSEILQEDVADLGQESLMTDLKKIEASGRHLLGLINDILDLSKVEAGRTELYIEDVDLASLFEEVQVIVAPLIQKNSNTLELRLADDLGSIRTDRTKLKQSVLNVLSNANKFTENGRLRVVAERFQADRPMVRIAISDTGIGMDEEQLGRLFQAFGQVDASTTKKYGGTGLGLAITRHFCQLLRGDITVKSKPGEGSTFTITLQDLGTKPEQTADAVAGVFDTAAEVDGASTVLIVDDDPVARDLLSASLKGKGYRIVHAGNGDEALNLARKLRPDAITLDIIMPQTDGWAVLTALKGDAELRDIPVVIVTILQDRAIGLSLGAVDFLTKPVDRARLTALLHELLRREGLILLVEDESNTRAMLRQAIERMDLEVAEAVNGRGALEWLAQNQPPALILLDIMMPEMDGFEFLDAFRKHPEWQDIPVIVLTAKELTAQERERLMGQTRKVIAKGDSFRDDIAAAIGAAIRRPAAHAAAASSACLNQESKEKGLSNAKGAAGRRQ